MEINRRGSSADVRMGNAFGYVSLFSKYVSVLEMGSFAHHTKHPITLPSAAFPCDSVSVADGALAGVSHLHAQLATCRLCVGTFPPAFPTDWPAVWWVGGKCQLWIQQLLAHLAVPSEWSGWLGEGEGMLCLKHKAPISNQ